MRTLETAVGELYDLLKMRYQVKQELIRDYDTRGYEPDEVLEKLKADLIEISLELTRIEDSPYFARDGE